MNGHLIFLMSRICVLMIDLERVYAVAKKRLASEFYDRPQTSSI